MRNITSLLLIMVACLIKFNASAQWSVEVHGGGGGGSPLTMVCPGLPTGNFVFRLYHTVGGTTTDETANATIYQAQIGTSTALFSPAGSPGLIYRGSAVAGGLYPTGGQIGTGAGYGQIQLTAMVAGSTVATTICTVYPSGEVFTGVVSGSTTIGASGSFTLNTASHPPYVSSTGTWTVNNGPYNIYYTPAYGATYTGTVFSPVPMDRAPLYNGGTISVYFYPTTTFTCGYNWAGTTPLNRIPVISSSLAPANIICGSGSAVLTVNCNAPTAVPTTGLTGLGGGVVNEKNVKFTYQWYNGSTAISGANAYTVSATTPGDYKCLVTQLELQDNVVGTTHTWTWKSAPTTTPLYSNIIHIAGPMAGTLAPSANINGTALSPTTSGLSSTVYACGTNTLTLNSFGGSGVYSYLVQIVSGPTGGTLTTVASGTSSSNTTPISLPTGLNITPYFAGAATGWYGIKVTVSNGCGTPTTWQRYMYVVMSAPLSGTVTSGTGLNTGAIASYGVTDGSTYASRQVEGRTSGYFYANPAFSTTSAPVSSCHYQPILYKVIGGVKASSPIWTGSVTAVACTTSGYIPVVTMPMLGFAPSGSGYSWTGPIWSNLTLTPSGSDWCMTLVLTNNCGSSTTDRYFTLNDAIAYRDGNNNALTSIEGIDKIQFVPVPFDKGVTINLNLAEAAKTSLVITAVDGRVISTEWENEPMQNGATQRTINTEKWAPGLYFYKFTVNGKSYSGKIQKN